jgi:glucosamine-6-phosphate isomerase
MKLLKSKSYEESSERAADELIRLMNASSDKLVCMASGDSPGGLYKQVVLRVKAGVLDISEWHFVGLDEWVGMNGEDEGSCRYHLNQQFFFPLQVTGEKICFFDGRAADLEKECARTSSFIRKHGGIHVAIVGLGMNGHIGMNEPGTSPALHPHVTAIHEQTQQVAQKYFSSAHAISHGITLGIADILAARHVMLLVNGAQKAAIVKRILEEEISEALPASFLRSHPSLSIYLDEGAAKLLHDY